MRELGVFVRSRVLVRELKAGSSVLVHPEPTDPNVRQRLAKKGRLRCAAGLVPLQDFSPSLDVRLEAPNIPLQASAGPPKISRCGRVNDLPPVVWHQFRLLQEGIVALRVSTQQAAKLFRKLEFELFPFFGHQSAGVRSFTRRQLVFGPGFGARTKFGLLLQVLQAGHQAVQVGSIDGLEEGVEPARRLGPRQVSEDVGDIPFLVGAWIFQQQVDNISRRRSLTKQEWGVC